MATLKHYARKAPGKSRGQALVEFALVMPILLLLLAVVATGGQMLASDISLTQAARAGAVAAAEDASATPKDPISVQTTDARTAANNEQGGANVITCSGSGVPSGCVTVTDLSAPGPGLENNTVSLAKCQIWDTIQTFVPLFGNNITIEAEATAPQ